MEEIEIETTVIEGDRNQKFQLDFKIFEYIGTEVIREEDFKKHLNSDIGVLIEKYRITDVNGISARADAAESFHSLSFGEDDRKCWVCSVSISNKALERINFQ